VAQNKGLKNQTPMIRDAKCKFCVLQNLQDGNTLIPMIRWNFANNRTHGVIQLKLGNLQPWLFGQVQVFAYLARTKDLKKLLFVFIRYIYSAANGTQFLVI
jgi:hypothetical protein